MKFYPQKGAGPDLLLEGGGVVEVKGTNFDIRKAFEQFIRYPLTYLTLEIALPIDALELKTLYTLNLIEKSLKSRTRPSIRVYLIVGIGEGKYKVRVHASSEDLFNYVTVKLVEKLYIPFDVNLEDCIQKNHNTVINLDNEIKNILEDDAKSFMSYEVIL